MGGDGTPRWLVCGGDWWLGPMRGRVHTKYLNFFCISIHS